MTEYDDHIFMMPVQKDGYMEWSCTCGRTGKTSKYPEGWTAERTARKRWRQHVGIARKHEAEEREDILEEYDPMAV